MKSISFVLSIVFFVFRVNAQTPTTKDYFQQEVNYKINVSLNDQNHTLKGDINIHYKNNAPVALDTIFMHLWPNAYSSKLTAFAQQQVQNGSSQFYFSKEEDLGNISQLDFKVDGRKVKWQTLNKSTPDIAYIVLNQPLPPNQSIDIQTPFTVKIPASFSRLGHVKTSYQISQWYPKPAVFDQKGWHPMPYLDQGEFFSEFGNFDVTITLPQNYLVAATGELQTASEKEFLAQKVIESQPIINADTLGNHFPPSATETKTIRFKAQKVHDFAWFADKRFLVTKDTLQLPSGKIVDAWAFFPPQGIDNWKNATDYIKRALRSYSNWIGEYPYSHATAVLSALGAGGGMEYPMITVIGKTFSPEGTDIVITHEVGHNWFYGILASNERDYAWMDEGINTFYENRYSTKFYPPEESQKKKISYEKLAYFLKARTHSDIPSITPPDRMSEMDYGIAAYAKPSFDLDMLETLLGRPAFDQIMQKYYQAWKFKHPYPEDFRQILQANTDKNISWFFDALNTTKTMDYTISSVHQDGQTADVTITNKGSLRGPLILFAKKYGQVQDSLVAEGFEGSKTFSFPKLKDGLYDDFEIDPHLKTIDLYP
ncbi:MAG TPA: M1 family peptidase, partial [Saprospiraceae bacterium]|nr:M1 family peptidase [Saprospiraceae bacterium]